MPLKKSKKVIANEWYDRERDRIDWNQKFARDQFRLTDSWKNFTRRIIKHHCDCCGLGSKNLAIHHLYPKKYDELIKENFACLCPRCHKTVTIQSRKKDKSKIPEFWLQFLERDEE